MWSFLTSRRGYNKNQDWQPIGAYLMSYVLYDIFMNTFPSLKELIKYIFEALYLCIHQWLSAHLVNVEPNI